MLPPHCTADYSREHDRAVASCLRTLLYGEEAPELPADAIGTAQLPLGLGGLGLRSATFGASALAAPHPPHGDGHLRGWQRAAVAACDSL